MYQLLSIQFFGGVGISVGLWLVGRLVMETIGEDLTKVTPSSGLATEIVTLLTVLIASSAGIAIPITNGIVGSVVFVGRFRSRSNVHWKIFNNIITRLFTLLAAAGATAFLMFGFMQVPR
jgi:solute carrier family 20 (sodium-dependent phosphate transporter)